FGDAIAAQPATVAADARMTLLVSVLATFFFQAEDGIRDGHVTGVQTCALPISPPDGRESIVHDIDQWACRVKFDPANEKGKKTKIGRASCRKECRSRWSPDY